MPEDILWFLENMGDFIRIAKEVKAELEQEKKANIFQIRLSKSDREKIEKFAKKSWYDNLSSYARDRLLQEA